MNQKFVITVGRQFGSGGRDIAKALSEMFGIAYYDKELMHEAARESGLCPEYFDRVDEKAPSPLLHALSSGFGYDGILSGESIFRFQSEAVLKLVERESCVIVGRCADYILRDHPRCYSVFVHAPEAFRLAQVVAREGLTPKQAAEKMVKADKTRSSYYNFYTEKTWGASSSYLLSIDASVLGMEGTAQFIRSFIEKNISR